MIILEYSGNFIQKSIKRKKAKISVHVLKYPCYVTVILNYENHVKLNCQLISISFIKKSVRRVFLETSFN